MVVAIWLPELLWQAECVGRPELRGRPMVVGGQAARGGTVAAASPAARQRGVRVGQPVADAARCAEDAVVLPGRVDRVIDVAAVVHARLEALLGPVTWMTVGRAVAAVDPVHVSRLHNALDTIRDEAASTLGVSVACGIAPTWIGADVASRLMAPAGLLHIVPRSQQRMLAPLSVKWLPGMDDRTVERLARGGVLTFGDLAALDRDTGHRLVGRSATVLARLASGVDDRRVPNGVPLSRVAACIAVPAEVDAAIASLVERAAGAGRAVAEARVRFCSLQGSQADRVERVGGGPRRSLADLQRILSEVVGRGRTTGPTLVTLEFGCAPPPSLAARGMMAHRRTA